MIKYKEIKKIYIKGGWTVFNATGALCDVWWFGIFLIFTCTTKININKLFYKSNKGN